MMWHVNVFFWFLTTWKTLNFINFRNFKHFALERKINKIWVLKYARFAYDIIFKKYLVLIKFRFTTFRIRFDT